jgi:hypothetical protein
MEELLCEGLRVALGLSGEERDIAKYVCSLKSGVEAQDYLRSLLPPSPTADTLVQAIGDQFAQQETQAVAHLQASQEMNVATAAAVAAATAPSNSNNYIDAAAPISHAGEKTRPNISPKEEARLQRKARKAARVSE